MSGQRLVRPAGDVSVESIYRCLAALSATRGIILKDKRAVPARVHELLGVEARGLCFTLKGKHYICVDGELPIEKKAFILAHELGHFMLHEKCQSCTAYDSNYTTRKESEADLFATKLLALITLRLAKGRN